jgi:hypothetical protein
MGGGGDLGSLLRRLVFRGSHLHSSKTGTTESRQHGKEVKWSGTRRPVWNRARTGCPEERRLPLRSFGDMTFQLVKEYKDFVGRISAVSCVYCQLPTREATGNGIAVQHQAGM